MRKKRVAHSKGDEVIIFVTTSTEEEAARISQAVVDARLAACANVLPRIRSIYRWEGKVVDEQESLILMKSRASHFERLEKEVKRLHSYRVPEIIAVPLTHGSSEYLRWIYGETIRP